MTFLLQCLWIVVVAYAGGAVAAEVLMRSGEERRLAAAPRALFGLLIITTWFAAAWQFLTIGQCWLLGIAVLGLIAFRRVTLAELRASLGAHARGCAAVVAVAIVFFAPLIAARNYGPFSESSGDITIYSDGSQLMVGKGLTSFGERPQLEKASSNLRAMLDFREADRFERYAALRERLVEDFRARIDPPSAEFGANRLVANIFFSSIYYAPYAQFQPFAGALNYPVFFGVEAFFYAAMALCLWHFFRPFGRTPAAIALALAASSHALVSVHYNGYSMQAISLAVCAAYLLACTRVPLFSRAGVRVYGFGMFVVWLCYTHFMTILAPLALVAALVSLPAFRPAGDVAPQPALARSARVAGSAALAVALLAFGLLFIGGSANAVDFILRLFMNFAQGVKSEYLGDAIPVRSWQWLSFAFGLVSQQHMPPFVAEIAGMPATYRAGIVAGLASVLLGLAAMASWAMRPPPPARARAVMLACYATLVATILAHLYLAQGSLYTQAKGAQNLLVCLYAALALPLAVTWLDPRFSHSWLRRALAAALCALVAATLVPRFVFGDHLGRGMDRAVVMEPSYFDEAERVLAADPDAFVLFEPRKSADVYLSTEPFFGARLVPTRHLALTRIRSGDSLRRPRPVNGSFLVEEDDIGHLWIVGAQRKDGRDAWRAHKVASSSAPMLLLFAHDYAQDQRLRIRPGSGDPARFSWLRNGAATVFLPPGAHAVEAIAIPANAARLRAMRVELSQRVAAGELPGARVEERDGALVLAYDMPASAAPRLVRVAFFWEEYWLNVRVDGRDIGKSAFAAPDSARLTATPGPPADNERAVRVTWEVDDADAQDWIGIFPEAGEDASRIAFKFTGGRKSGALELALPAASQGAFEVRFFRAGSWSIAGSARVVVGRGADVK